MMKHFIFIAIATLVCCSCTVIKREIRYGTASVDDYKIFPYTEINPSDSVYYFKQGNEAILKNYMPQNIDKKKYGNVSLDEFLQKTSTVAFLVIRNDSVLFEKYYNGYNKSQIATVFSVSKSITSLLVGLAVDEGYIESVDDPVTKYIPELVEADPHFRKLTVEHLLNMRSGLKYDESYSNPFSAMAKLYYGNNQLGQIKKMKFAHEPGTVHSYQSVSTALLGIIVEKTTGKELGKYLEEKIAIPLGFENKATWSLDDKKHRSTKAYQGLNITAIDLAKIGRLYANSGNWDGKQLIDSAWVA